MCDDYDPIRMLGCVGHGARACHEGSAVGSRGSAVGSCTHVALGYATEPLVPRAQLLAEAVDVAVREAVAVCSDTLLTLARLRLEKLRGRQRHVV